LVIGFDVIFAEPDRVSPPILADKIGDISDDVRAYLRGLPDSDEGLATIVGATRTVLAQAGNSDPNTLAGRPPPNKKAAIAEIGGDPRRKLVGFDGLTRNIPSLEAAAPGLGMINVSAEKDGIARRVPLAMNVAGKILPALGIEMLRLATGQSTIGVRSDNAGINSVVVAGVAIPTDENGRVWVRFSEARSVRYIPVKDILDGSADKSLVAGKFVLIGTSAVGLLDTKTTPVSAFMPGVEMHAHFLANVLTQNLLSRPNFFKLLEIGLTVLISLLILILTPRLSAAATLLFGGTFMAVLAGTSWYLFTTEGILFDVSATGVTAFTIYAALTYIKYVREEADKKQVRRTFSQYLAPAVVDRLAEHPEQLKLGGETRDMTILFSDIRGFTTIAEHTDATELTALINRILTPMTDAVLVHGGTVDKYIGDCLMAFWNAPIDDSDHARNGCLAALDMIRRIKELNQTLRAESAKFEDGHEMPEIRIGVGLNSGSCCVGNIGSAQRFDYSVLGDSVNLSSRLEGQTGYYGCPIVVGESTAAAAPDLAMVRIDRIKVIGRQQPVEIFAVLGDADYAEELSFRRFKEEHDAFMDAYFGRRWDAAAEKLRQCREMAERLDLPFDKFYALFEERLDEFREADTDESWDGVFVAIKK
jgi:adenylate cyclase